MSLTTPFAILSMPKYNKAKIAHTCVLKFFKTCMSVQVTSVERNVDIKGKMDKYVQIS